MNKLNYDKCTFCKNVSETIHHLFWKCNVLQTFWTNLGNYIEGKCSLVKINWSETAILFGNLKLDICLNKIDLLAKMCIYQKKMETNKKSNGKAF